MAFCTATRWETHLLTSFACNAGSFTAYAVGKFTFPPRLPSRGRHTGDARIGHEQPFEFDSANPIVEQISNFGLQLWGQSQTQLPWTQLDILFAQHWRFVGLVYP